MMNSSTKKLCIILAIIIVVVIGIYYGLFTIIHHTADTIAENELKVQEKMEQDKNDRSLKSFIMESGADIDRLESRIIPSDGVVAFIEKVESYGRKSGAVVSIVSVDAKPVPTNPEAFESLVLNVSARGSWDATYRFLSMLENFPYKMTISDVVLSEERNASSTSLWNGGYIIHVLKRK